MVHSLDALEDVSLQFDHLSLDSLSQALIGDDEPELNVELLGALGEIGAGDDQELVVDGDELGVVADLAPVELPSPKDSRRPELRR